MLKIVTYLLGALFGIFFWAFLLMGCSGIALLHAVDSNQALTPEQIKAFRELGQDVYTCLQVGGPPPAGNVVTVVLPKGSTVPIKFGDNCHIIQ